MNYKEKYQNFLKWKSENLASYNGCQKNVLTYLQRLGADIRHIFCETDFPEQFRHIYFDEVYVGGKQAPQMERFVKLYIGK